MRWDNADFNWVLNPTICKDAEKILNQLVQDPCIHVYITSTDENGEEKTIELTEKIKIDAYRIETIKV